MPLATLEAEKDYLRDYYADVPPPWRCGVCGRFVGREDHQCPHYKPLTMEEITFWCDEPPPDGAQPCSICEGNCEIKEYDYHLGKYCTKACPGCDYGWEVLETGHK